MIEIKNIEEVRGLLQLPLAEDDFFLTETDNTGKVIRIKLVTDEMLINAFN